MQTGALAWSCVLAAVLASPAAAQQAGPEAAASNAPSPQATAPEPAPAKRWTMTTGLDFTSAYLFRGIHQHSGGTIAQPTFDLGVAVGRGVSVNVGNWDSVHSTAPSRNWYESDLYSSVTFTAGRLKPAVLYTSYTSPADSFATVKELAGVFTVDEGKSPFPILPKVVVAFELGEGQADGGASKGVYLELGAKPNVKLARKLSVYLPVRAGFSLKDYYEGPLGTDRFGYFNTGFQLSVPAVSGPSGTLEIHGGMDFQVLGDNLKLLNNDERVKPIGTIGFTYSY